MIRQPEIGRTYNSPTGEERTVKSMGKNCSPNRKDRHWLSYESTAGGISGNCSFEDFWRWLNSGTPHRDGRGRVANQKPAPQNSSVRVLKCRPIELSDF